MNASPRDWRTAACTLDYQIPCLVNNTLIPPSPMPLPFFLPSFPLPSSPLPSPPLPLSLTPQVDFHDTSSSLCRVPALSDRHRCTLASLGPRGYALASPSRHLTQYGTAPAQQRMPSALLYRPFAAWAHSSDVRRGREEGDSGSREGGRGGGGIPVVRSVASLLNS